MTTMPAVGAFLPAAGRTNESRGPLFEQWAAFTRELVGGGPPAALAISGGAIQPQGSAVIVDTEGQAASDDLDRIDQANRPEGSFLFLRSADPGRDVRVRGSQGGAGQIVLANPAGQGGNLVLADPSMLLVLQREGTLWAERWRAYGSQNGAQRAQLGLAESATMPAATDAEAKAGTSDARLLTPASLLAVLADYAALIGGRPLRATAADRNDEVLLGTNDGERDIVARISVANLLASDPPFDSGELPATAGTAGSAAHELGVRPRDVQPFLLCKAAELSYNPGDVVRVETVYAASETRGVQVGANADEVFWKVKAAHNLAVLNGSNQYAVIDPAKWRLVVRAWH